jgi:hypothetical protein
VLGVQFEKPTPEAVGSGLPLSSTSSPVALGGALSLVAFLIFVTWRHRRDDEDEDDEEYAWG